MRGPAGGLAAALAVVAVVCVHSRAGDDGTRALKPVFAGTFSEGEGGGARPHTYATAGTVRAVGDVQSSGNESAMCEDLAVPLQTVSFGWGGVGTGITDKGNPVIFTSPSEVRPALPPNTPFAEAEATASRAVTAKMAPNSFDKPSANRRNTAARVDLRSRVVAVHAAGWQAVALVASGKVWRWRTAADTHLAATAPSIIEGVPPIRLVCAGRYHVAMVSKWKREVFVAVRPGDAAYPVPIPAQHGRPCQLSCAENRTLVVTDTGRLLQIDMEEIYQTLLACDLKLAEPQTQVDGTEDPRLASIRVPASVFTLKGLPPQPCAADLPGPSCSTPVCEVSASSEFDAILLNDGRVLAVSTADGSSSVLDQTVNNRTSDNITMISASEDAVAASTASGRIRSWHMSSTARGGTAAAVAAAATEDGCVSKQKVGAVAAGPGYVLAVLQGAQAPSLCPCMRESNRYWDTNLTLSPPDEGLLGGLLKAHRKDQERRRRKWEERKEREAKRMKQPTIRVLGTDSHICPPMCGENWEAIRCAQGGSGCGRFMRMPFSKDPLPGEVVHLDALPPGSNAAPAAPFTDWGPRKARAVHMSQADSGGGAGPQANVLDDSVGAGLAGDVMEGPAGTDVAAAVPELLGGASSGRPWEAALDAAALRTVDTAPAGVSSAQPAASRGTPLAGAAIPTAPTTSMPETPQQRARA